MSPLITVAILSLLTWALYKGCFLSNRSTPFPAEALPPRAVDLMAQPGVNQVYVASFTARFIAAGFEPLMDYEMPHLRAPGRRSLGRVLRCADGRVTGQIGQLLLADTNQSTAFLTTSFQSGKRLFTTNSVVPVPGDPMMVRQAMPGCEDVAAMLKRHQEGLETLREQGERVRLVSVVEDFSREAVLGWRGEVERYVAAGRFVRVGQQLIPSKRNGWWSLWNINRPLRPGHGARWHLGVLGLPIGLLAMAHQVQPLSQPWLLYGVPAASGAFLGAFMGLHGLAWMLALPVVWGMSLDGGLGVVCGAINSSFLGYILTVSSSYFQRKPSRLPL